ncbi:MAG: DUF6653 family protein [Arenicella sp.]
MKIDLMKWAEKLMVMDEDVWQRHANPWSVYTRFTVLPFMSLAFYSREWLGVYSLILIALSFVWIWLNPRLFKAPKSTKNWASMGTFGERVYLNRHQVPIPEQHLRPALVLQVLSGVGIPFFIYGLYALNLWSLLMGNVLIMVFKTWFVDRMVWLYLDMKDDNSEYKRWLR